MRMNRRGRWPYPQDVTEAIVRYALKRIGFLYPDSVLGRQLDALRNKLGASPGKFSDWRQVALADVERPLRYLREDEKHLLIGLYCGSDGFRQARKGSGGKEVGKRTARHMTVERLAERMQISKHACVKRIQRARGRVRKAMVEDAKIRSRP